MNKPRISVISPLFNKEDYIKAAIESVLQQEFACCEIIIVDDGSTDRGAEIVESISDPRIKLIRQTNAGVAAARNCGIEQAQGEFVAFLDADDLYLPNFLKTIADMIERFPEAAIYSTGYIEVYPDGKRVPIRNRFFEKQNSPFLVPDFFLAWSNSGFFCASSVCIKRSVLETSDARFCVGEQLGEDQDFWFRLAGRYQIAHSKNCLTIYNREITGSLTTDWGPVSSLAPCYLRLAERLEKGELPLNLIGGARAVVAGHYITVAGVRISQDDFAGAWQLLLHSRASGRPFYRLRNMCALLNATISKSIFSRKSRI